MPARSLSSASFTLQLFLDFAFCLTSSPSSSPPANAGVIVVAATAPKESKDAAAIRATTTTISWCLLMLLLSLFIFYNLTSISSQELFGVPHISILKYVIIKRKKKKGYLVTL